MRLLAQSKLSIPGRLTSAAPLALGAFVLAAALQAQVTLGPVTVGAGLQASYLHTDPTGGSSTDQFLVNHARLYFSGSATENIKFMFNTDYDSSTNKIGVLDAAAQFEFSRKFNLWAGRFLPPSDRANLYGPYLFARMGCIYGRYTGWLSLRVSRPRQRCDVLGRLR